MEMLKDMETMLAARSTQAVWQHYAARLVELGFPNVSYHAVRILEARCGRMPAGSILLSSYSAGLMLELADAEPSGDMPSQLWLGDRRGSKSWAWLHQRRQEGRLTPGEGRALDVFARHGHVSGYTIGLSDEVERICAGVIVGGGIGLPQDGLDELWARHGRVVELLTGLMHLRIWTLPWAERECVLTARQREVLECISIGRTTQEIAQLLSITPATVEKHLRLARKALGAKTTVQAILLAASRGQVFNTATARQSAAQGRGAGRIYPPPPRKKPAPGAPCGPGLRGGPLSA